jgi:hypothetical protein
MSPGDCPRCAGTGKRRPNETKALLRCRDCNAPSQSYMVRDEIWLAAWPTYNAERRALIRAHKTTNDPCHQTMLLLCFSCLDKRLGRPLRPDDFKLSLSVNAGIVLGMRMSAR